MCSGLTILLSVSNIYRPTYIDHKPNFENKVQSRLIDPSKTELGKILKNIIQNIVTNVKKRLTIVIFGETRMTPLNGLRKLKIRVRLH